MVHLKKRKNRKTVHRTYKRKNRINGSSQKNERIEKRLVANTNEIIEQLVHSQKNERIEKHVHHKYKRKNRTNGS